jgi:hypothetical protein
MRLVSFAEAVGLANIMKGIFGAVDWYWDHLRESNEFGGSCGGEKGRGLSQGVESWPVDEVCRSRSISSVQQYTEYQ